MVAKFEQGPEMCILGLNRSVTEHITIPILSITFFRSGVVNIRQYRHCLGLQTKNVNFLGCKSNSSGKDNAIIS